MIIPKLLKQPKSVTLAAPVTITGNVVVSRDPGLTTRSPIHLDLPAGIVDDENAIALLVTLNLVPAYDVDPVTGLPIIEEIKK